MNTYHRVYATVNLDNVLHNIKEMQRIINDNTKIMAVIKTDGYGHGAVPIGKELEKLSCVGGYAVATVEEGMILRRNGLQKPILVLGATFPEQYEVMADLDMRATVYSLNMAMQMQESMEKRKKTLKVHIKIDTGLSRLGFQVTEQDANEIAQIASQSHIIIEGIFTHFVKSDAYDKTMAYEQITLFEQMKQLLLERGICPEICHCSNSAGIIDLPKANMDLVRAGISLYGLWPSDEVEKNNINLFPVMSLKSTIVFIKELEAGRSISYGATYMTEKKSRIATIPVGYGDGYPRSLSNKGYVLIHGQKAPICGRICMDQFMVDVSDIKDVKEGDEVVLIGRSGEQVITMEELGELSGRFNYEFACDLGKRIPRVYVKEGRVTETKDYFSE